MEGIIISLALLVFLAHLFSALFTKTGLPDVLPMMLLGIVIGPVFRLVDPADFGMVDKVFTQVLLIVILFESGLGIRISHIRSTWTQSSRLTVISFIITAASVTALAMIALAMPLAYALILGIILADNSFAVIIPLISKLNISNNTRTVLLVECTMGSVLVIVGAISMLQMAKMQTFAPSVLIANIIYSLCGSFLAGTIAAVFWTTILSKIRKLENSIFLTLAFVLVVYSVCEALGADGAIGAFIFGVIAGNIRVIRHLNGFKFIETFTLNAKSKAFNGGEKNFFNEIVFILRAFFFVYIGICMHINSMYSMLCGLLFTMVIFMTRIPIANFVLDKSISRIDTAVVSAMVPKGLVTAVLASLVARSGISGAQVLQDTIYSVILFSIIFATMISFSIERGYGMPAINFLFKRHAVSGGQPQQQHQPPAHGL